MGELSRAEQDRLEAIFERARRYGDLGPAPVTRHVDHALALASCLDDVPLSFLDLGSGGGVPGLVLALLWPESEAVLVEGQVRRAERLEAAVMELELHGRCRVVAARAEEAGHDPVLRERFPLVVARAFEGGPAVVAECGAAFLGVGGLLLVSEPPEDDPERWPVEGLGVLGLGPAQRRTAGQATAAAIPKVAATEDRYPRRTGIPAKRPLW